MWTVESPCRGHLSETLRERRRRRLAPHEQSLEKLRQEAHLHGTRLRIRVAFIRDSHSSNQFGLGSIGLSVQLGWVHSVIRSFGQNGLGSFGPTGLSSFGLRRGLCRLRRWASTVLVSACFKNKKIFFFPFRFELVTYRKRGDVGLDEILQRAAAEDDVAERQRLVRSLLVEAQPRVAHGVVQAVL